MSSDEFTARWPKELITKVKHYRLVNPAGGHGAGGPSYVWYGGVIITLKNPDTAEDKEWYTNRQMNGWNEDQRLMSSEAEELRSFNAWAGVKEDEEAVWYCCAAQAASATPVASWTEEDRTCDTTVCWPVPGKRMPDRTGDGLEKFVKWSKRVEKQTEGQKEFSSRDFQMALSSTTPENPLVANLGGTEDVLGRGYTDLADHDDDSWSQISSHGAAMSESPAGSRAASRERHA
jgi:hypothetical protein